MIVEVVSDSPARTERLGALLAGASEVPLTVGLSGDLGAGKTCFVRGLVGGLDRAAAAEVSSPTYAICNLYPSDPPVAHFDLYRLEDAEELEGVGFREADEGWRVVEWIERIAEAHAVADLRIAFTRGAADRRELRLESVSPAGERALVAFAAAAGAVAQPTESR